MFLKNVPLPTEKKLGLLTAKRLKKWVLMCEYFK
jgi:hypothetical protein